MNRRVKKEIVNLFTPTSGLAYANRFTVSICLLTSVIDIALLVYNKIDSDSHQTFILNNVVSGSEIDYTICLLLLAFGGLVWSMNSDLDSYVHTSVIFGAMIVVLQILFQCMGSYSLSLTYIIIMLTIIYARPILTLVIGAVVVVVEIVNYWTILAVEQYSELAQVVDGTTWGIKQSFYENVLFYLPMTLVAAIFMSICIKRLFQYVRDYTNQQAVIESSNTAAALIQHQIIESTHIDETAKDNVSLYPFLETADYVAGDFYDYYSIDRHHICFMIADVSGKGMAAGLFMVKAKEVLRVISKDRYNPAKVVERANKELCDNNSECMFASAWVGILDLRSGIVTYSNAGHTSPILVSNGRVITLNDVSGPLLGLFPKKEYKKHTVKLYEGDRILLYTDGVTEQPVSDEARYDENGLVEFIKTNVDKDNLCNEIYKELMSYDRKQFDDITMLQLNMNKLKTTTSKIGKEIDRKMFLAATPKSIRTLRKVIMDEFEDSLLDKTTVNTFYVACEEMATNIIKYAYGSADNNGGFQITIRSEDDYIDIILMDTGVAFNPFLFDKSINANKEGEITEGGRGIKIFTEVMDEYSYKRDEDTNIVVARKYV